MDRGLAATRLDVLKAKDAGNLEAYNAASEKQDLLVTMKVESQANKPTQQAVAEAAPPKPHPFAHLNEKIASAGGCVTGLQCTAGLNQTHIQAQAGAGQGQQPKSAGVGGIS